MANCFWFCYGCLKKVDGPSHCCLDDEEISAVKIDCAYHGRRDCDDPKPCPGEGWHDSGHGFRNYHPIGGECRLCNFAQLGLCTEACFGK